MKIKTNMYPLITVISMAILMIVLLFVLRVGVSDNGNLNYTLENLGIYNCQQTDGCYTDTFGVSSKTTGDGTSGLVYAFVKTFVPVDSVISSHIPAIIYMIMFLAGMYLALKNLLGESRGNNIIMCVLAAVVLADGAYLALFNTPYPQGAFISYFALLIGTFAAYSKTEKTGYLILLLISALLFVLTGVYAAITGVLLAFAILSLVKKQGKVRKVLAVVFACVVLISSVFAFSIETTGDNMIYNRVFGGILKVAENKEQALTDMGINPEFSIYANEDFFSEKAQSFINSKDFQQVRDNATTLKTAKYYITHIGELAKAVKKAESSAFVIKSGYLYDYPASGNKAYEHNNFWTIYSKYIKKIIPAMFILSVILCAFVIFFAISFKNKNKECEHISYLISAISLGMVLSFPIAIFNNGFSCVDFYMRGFNYLFDFVVVFAITGGTRYMWLRQQFLREKYGVNQ